MLRFPKFLIIVFALSALPLAYANQDCHDEETILEVEELDKNLKKKQTLHERSPRLRNAVGPMFGPFLQLARVPMVVTLGRFKRNDRKVSAMETGRLTAFILGSGRATWQIAKWPNIAVAAAIAAGGAVLWKYYQEPLVSALGEERIENVASSVSMMFAAVIAYKAGEYAWQKLSLPIRHRVNARFDQESYKIDVGRATLMEGRAPDLYPETNMYYSARQFAGTFRERGSVPALANLMEKAAGEIVNGKLDRAALEIADGAQLFIRWFVDVLDIQIREEARFHEEESGVHGYEMAKHFFRKFEDEGIPYPSNEQIQALLQLVERKMRNDTRSRDRDDALVNFIELVLRDVLLNPEKYDPRDGTEDGLFASPEGQEFLNRDRSGIAPLTGEDIERILIQDPEAQTGMEAEPGESPGEDM